MQTDLPVFSTDEEALKAAVQNSGGMKIIGAKLWPDVGSDIAARKLADALNENRSERLKPSQVRLILREAHSKVYHAAAQWFMGESGYTVTVMNPVAQEDRAIEAVNAARETLDRAILLMERQMRVRVAA